MKTIWTIQWTYCCESDILLLHDDADDWDEEGHGAGILSFRSQIKLIPDDLSSVASEGKLGRRHPDSNYPPRKEQEWKWEQWSNH